MTASTLAAALAAPSADNSQHWRFDLCGDTLSVSYRARHGLDPFGSQGHATLLGIGAVAENLSQNSKTDSDALRWASESACGPYFSWHIDRRELNERANQAVLSRHTNRFKYGTEAPQTSALESLIASTEGTARIQVLPAGKAFDDLSEVTRTCCMARFCNRELHDWLMGSLRFSRGEIEAGDGLDVNTIDLPPGGASFMHLVSDWKRMALLNRLQIYRLMADMEVRKLRNASMLVCVVGPGGYRDSLDAGRLMQRVWIELNKQGWGVHPFYVVADQQTRHIAHRIPTDWARPVGQALDDLPGILSLDANERLHIVLRVGRPLVKSPPRSRRLPVERLLISE
ncbi:nitroreductase family protein [Cognatazoarcus halotolerans]|uniref:hypothetical protein n=1 Tax=Cognatazoarcus halotolerans TaxID=2686016 RepID=UPI00135C2741|nr:hypothetical protein [Cognatazoarcus halotolerans]MCB1900411.1 hypothetical protein [Rhodocyclaceae bacterium]MCP5309809.1 hypothetical protein [Zoogloeaceae bacterium]